MLEPNIDLYGSKARESSLADSLEAAALSGAKMSVAGLGDYIQDAGWATKLKEHFVGPELGPLEETFNESSARARAGRVFELLEERAAVLGEVYPFAVSDAGLVYRAERAAEGYLVLLGITLAHAYGLETASGLNPRHAMEDLTVAALRARRMTASKTSCGSGKGGFAERLLIVGEELGLRPTPERGYVSRRSKDEGVDVLAVFAWGDARPGQWVFIGQVTCATSDAWLGKLSEPSPNQWKELLGLQVRPVPFLAVPHHVQRGQLFSLTGKQDAVVLDRLRLAPFVLDRDVPFAEFSALAKTLRVTLS